MVLLYQSIEMIHNSTTISRPKLIDAQTGLEQGGLSGKPLFEKSLSVVKKFYKLTNGSVLIIGCGGIASGKDALKFIESGATLVQFYSAISVNNNLKDSIKVRGWFEKLKII